MLKIKVKVDENNKVIAWCDEAGSEGITLSATVDDEMYMKLMSGELIPDIEENRINIDKIKSKNKKDLKQIKQIDNRINLKYNKGKLTSLPLEELENIEKEIDSEIK